MNWPEALRHAVLRLSLTPAAFWALSLKEWRWLTAGGDPPLSRRDLEGLVERDGG